MADEAPKDPRCRMARLTTVSAYVEAFRDADLVVEAVFEDAKVKELVYGELCSGPG